MEKDFLTIFKLAREINDYGNIIRGFQWSNEEDRPTIERIKERVAELPEQLKLLS